MKYEFLDHTADAKFRAYGSNLEEAFENAALATFSILLNPEKVKPIITKEIKITSAKKTSLLYDFIEELLFLLDTEGFLLNKVENLKINQEDNFVLTCKVYGDSFKNYSISGNVKSITYNDMLIEEKEDNVMLQVVVDL
jgi:SHS2 domain-containing protein